MTVVTESSSNVTEWLKMSGFTVQFLQFFFSASICTFKTLKFSSISCRWQSKGLFTAFFGAVAVARSAAPDVGVKNKCFSFSDLNNSLEAEELGISTSIRLSFLGLQRWIYFACLKKNLSVVPILDFFCTPQYFAESKIIWFNDKHWNTLVGGAVAPWLVRSSPDRAVRVRALAGDIVLCSHQKHSDSEHLPGCYFSLGYVVQSSGCCVKLAITIVPWYNTAWKCP